MIYKHYRTEKHGCVSVAFQSADGRAEMGVAWCSPKDKFNRKKGRLIAEGRLERKRANGFYYSRAHPDSTVLPGRIYDLLKDMWEIPLWFDAFDAALKEKYKNETAGQV